MTTEDIIRMAREAHKELVTKDYPGHMGQLDPWTMRLLERFAKLVADHIYAEYLEQPTPKQAGVISVTIPEPVGYLCENAAGHRYFRWKKPPSVYKPIALYVKENT